MRAAHIQAWPFFQLSAKFLTDSYAGSAFGIQIPPQNRVPIDPYFEIRRPGATKKLPSDSYTVRTSSFRTNCLSLGPMAMKSSETTTSYVNLRFMNNTASSPAEITPIATASTKIAERSREDSGKSNWETIAKMTANDAPPNRI